MITMATKLHMPLSGAWCLPDFPPEVQVLGCVFRRARLWTSKPGDVAQYRQHVARRAMHMTVRNNGRWVIDHLDEYNPDHGLLLQHFFMDLCAPFQHLPGAV